MKGQKGKNITERKNKAGKTVYQVQVYVGKTTDETGKAKYIRESATFDTEREAKTWYKEKTAKTEENKRNFVQPTKETLAAFLDRWLEAKRRELRPTTWVTYEVSLRCHVRPILGNIPLADLPGATASIERMLGDMLAGVGAAGRKVSPRTCEIAKVVLGTALGDAVRLRLIPFNPAQIAKGPKQNPRKVEALDEHELELLFIAAKGNRMENLFSFLAYSGLRRGEALALRWDDLDLAKATVSIGRSLVPFSGDRHHLQEPKTAAGKRTITLPLPALEALKGQKVFQTEDKKAALATGKPYRNDGFIFTTETGGLIDPNNATRAFRRIRDQAGLPKTVPLHGLRHTAVSLQIAAGVPLEVVSKRIGHTRSGFTADTYGHLLPAMDRAAADRLDAYLTRNK